MINVTRQQGFTLIEVLLALAVLAIALTALMKSTAQNIANTHRLTEKTISHWVAMQAVSMVQLGLLSVKQNQESTQATTMLGQRWYWRAQISKTEMQRVQRITINVSKNQAGPFNEVLTAFRLAEHEK